MKKDWKYEYRIQHDELEALMETIRSAGSHPTPEDWEAWIKLHNYRYK
jgi:hypothetical protein